MIRISAGLLTPIFRTKTCSCTEASSILKSGGGESKGAVLKWGGKSKGQF